MKKNATAKKRITAGLILLQISVVTVYMFSTSCAPEKAVTITSSPDTATVYIAKQPQPLGKTSLKHTFDFGNAKKYDIIVKKPHYDDGHFSIEREPKDQLVYHVELRKSDTTSVELISFEPAQGPSGITLAKKTTRTTAFINTFEESTTAKACSQNTNNYDPTHFIGSLVVSPDGKNLVYSVFVKDTTLRKSPYGYSTILEKPVSSPGVQNITKKLPNILDLFPCFSTDGSFIFFSSTRNRDYPTIWRLQTLGAGGMTIMTNTEAQDIEPVVSPSTGLIYYSSLSPNAETPLIWHITHDGTLPTQLKEGESPAITPDGKEVLFIRDNKDYWVKHDTAKAKWFHPRQIWYMNADGEGETQLTSNTDFDIKDPSVSPDGKWVVYSCNQNKDKNGIYNYDIWIMKIDGTNQTALTTNGSYDDAPVWSPDGTKIYFRSNRGGYWNIWSFEPDLTALNR